jgi:hypothetical protein
MNNSDLNGQTAPESTRGFFDSPEVNINGQDGLFF